MLCGVPVETSSGRFFSSSVAPVPNHCNGLSGSNPKSELCDFICCSTFFQVMDNNISHGSNS